MAGQLPDFVSSVQAQAKKEGLDNAIIGRFAKDLIARAKDRDRVLKGT